MLTVALNTSVWNPCGLILTDSKDGKIQQSAAMRKTFAKVQETGLIMTTMGFQSGNSSAVTYKKRKRCYLIAHHRFSQPKVRGRWPNGKRSAILKSHVKETSVVSTFSQSLREMITVSKPTKPATCAQTLMEFVRHLILRVSQTKKKMVLLLTSGTSDVTCKTWTWDKRLTQRTKQR